MKFTLLLWLIFLTMSSSITLADSEKGHRQLFEAIRASDIATFKEILATGADPNKSTTNDWFRFSSSCESTKRGNSEFFDAIVESDALVDLVSPLGGFTGSMIACAIFYNNFEAYLRLQELGVDVNSIQNPGVKDTRLYTTPFHIAVMAIRFRIALDILQKINPSNSQIRTLSRIINQTVQIEGHPENPYREQLVEWLRSRGHKVVGAAAESKKD